MNCKINLKKPSYFNFLEQAVRGEEVLSSLTAYRNSKKENSSVDKEGNPYIYYGRFDQGKLILSTTSPKEVSDSHFLAVFDGKLSTSSQTIFSLYPSVQMYF